MLIFIYKHFYFTGLLIYAFYGVHNSLEGSKQQAIKAKENKQETKISN